MRAAATIAMLLVLPLAGCAAPTAPPASWLGEAPAPSTSCRVGEERTTSTDSLGQRVEVVEGCILVRDPDLFDDLGDIDVDVRVAQGVRTLVAQLHLRGDEPLRATLRDPAHRVVASGAMQGDMEHDSFVRFEVGAPTPGTWNLRGAVDTLTIARPWTAAFVTRA